MRPVSNSTDVTAVDAGFQRWNSPIPYLLSGLALMLGLITIALGILACSYIKSTSEAEDSSNKEVEMHVDAEPEILVIMAGDTNPTHLAKPEPCSASQSKGSASGKSEHS